MTPALPPWMGWCLAAGTGWLALSYELMWYRAYSIALMGRAHAFGFVLGAYLTGLGLGALVGARWCRRLETPQALRARLAWVLAAGACTGVALVPAASWVIAAWNSWIGAATLLSGAAFVLGLSFPLIIQAVVPGRPPGAGTARVYASNIAGAVVGAVGTGFVGMEIAGMGTLSVALSVVALMLALVVARYAPGAEGAQGKSGGPPLQLLAVVLVVAVVSEPALFAGTYERLFFRGAESASPRFVQVVENRSGVIAVTAEGAVYGGGVYDGTLDTDPRDGDRTQIERAFELLAFHPAPRRVLMIGLGSGSWATVIAASPLVEHLTVVEINAGYLTMLASHPEVSGLLANPKVSLVVADGRRWLLRHPDMRFDAIVANTVYHWRANASSLLSTEFLGTVRRHLALGGVLYYNTTSSPRVQRTGALMFPYAWRLAHLMAVSDSPIAPSANRLRTALTEIDTPTAPALDPSRDSDRAVVDAIVARMDRELEDRESLLSRTAGLEPITDDNMGSEWDLPPRFRWLQVRSFW